MGDSPHEVCWPLCQTGITQGHLHHAGVSQGLRVHPTCPWVAPTSSAHSCFTKDGIAAGVWGIWKGVPMPRLAWPAAPFPLSKPSQPPLSFPSPDPSCLRAFHHWAKLHWEPALLTPLHRACSLAGGSLLHPHRVPWQSSQQERGSREPEQHKNPPDNANVKAAGPPCHTHGCNYSLTATYLLHLEELSSALHCEQ